MNRQKCILGISIISIVLCYFGISFIELNVDFTIWSPVSRAIFMETSLIVLIFLFINIIKRF